MITRILETLSGHNNRMQRESESRVEAAKTNNERARRAEAAGAPNGIACPVCSHELGDRPYYVGGGLSRHQPPWAEISQQRGVLCPHCGYEGIRLVYRKVAP